MHHNQCKGKSLRDSEKLREVLLRACAHESVKQALSVNKPLTGDGKGDRKEIVIIITIAIIIIINIAMIILYR